MNAQTINESAGPLGGLPKHWIKYLAERWGKGGGSYDLAGENSVVTPIKFDPNSIKKALKDENNIAVIGRKDGEPIFMIAPHNNYTSKFRIFETEPSKGSYEAKGTSYYTGQRRRSYKTSDSYSMNEIIDIIDKMMANQEFEDLTVEAISKDPLRAEKAKERNVAKQNTDPLFTNPSSYGRGSITSAQKERAKKYGALKRPKLDARIDSEVKKIKDQLGTVLDQALIEVIDSIKKGYTYNVSKDTIARQIANKLDITGIQQLAKAYSAIKTDYASTYPDDMAKELKRTGLA